MKKLEAIKQDFESFLNDENGWKKEKAVTSHLKSLPSGISKELFTKVIQRLGVTQYPLFAEHLSREYLSIFKKIILEESEVNHSLYNWYYKYALVAFSYFNEKKDIRQHKQSMRFLRMVFNFDSNIHHVDKKQFSSLDSKITPAVIKCCTSLLIDNQYEYSKRDIFHNIFMYALVHSNTENLDSIVQNQLSNTNDYLGVYKMFAVLSIYKTSSNVQKPYKLVLQKLDQLNETSSMRQWMDQFHKFDSLTSWTVYLRVAEGEFNNTLDPHHAPNNVRIWISNIITPHFKVTVSKEKILSGGGTTDDWHNKIWEYAPNEPIEEFKTLINSSLENLSMELNWNNLVVDIEINLTRKENIPRGLKDKIKKWVQNQN